MVNDRCHQYSYADIACQMTKIIQFSNKFDVLYWRESSPWMREHSASQRGALFPKGFGQRESYRALKGFPSGSVVKNLPAMQETQETWVDSWIKKIPGGNGNPLQNSWLKNPMDRGAWQATVQKVSNSQTRLNDWALGKGHTKLQLDCLWGQGFSYNAYRSYFLG